MAPIMLPEEDDHMTRPCGRIPTSEFMERVPSAHSALIPANLMTFAHFSVSSTTNFSNHVVTMTAFGA